VKQNISSPLVRVHSDPHRTVHYILTRYLVASTIKTLKAELAERQRELARERQDSKKIRDELEQARDENAQTLEDLSAQNNKILETISLHHQENQGSPGVSEEVERKLDSLCQSMSGLHQLMANPAALSEDVASLGRGITTQLATFFGDLGSRVSEIDCAQKQHSPIIDEIANACRAIDERMQSEDGVAYWQDKCQEADQNLRVLEQHTRRIQSEADVASRHNQDLSIANNKLATEVSSLGEQVSSLEEKLQAAGNTAAAKDSNIKQALQTKDAEITELQSKLNHGKIDLEKLKQELQARDDENAAVATTHQNEVDGLQRRCTDTENQLRATENARSGIEKELQIANDKIRDLSQENGAEQVITFLKEEIRVLSEVAKEQKSIDTKLGDSAARLQAGDVRLAALAKQYDVLTRKYSEASKENDGLAETRSQYIELYQKVSGLSISNEQADSQMTTHAPTVDLEEVARTRRVTVKSPIEGPIPLAPSVEEERERRRLSVPGKSNLRGTTRSTSSELVIPLKIKSSSSQANDLDGSTARSASSQLIIPLKIKNSSSQENDIEEQTFTGPELVDNSRTRAYFNRSSFNRPVRGGNEGNSAVTNSGENNKRRRLSSSHATDEYRWVSGQDSANHPQDGNDSLTAPTHNTVLSPKNSTKRVLQRHDPDDVNGAEVRQHDATKSLRSSSQGKRPPRKASLLTYGNKTQESLPVETASASSQPITLPSIAPAGTKRKRSASALR
jgi:chromosome segregation ATPase